MPLGPSAPKAIGNKSRTYTNFTRLVVPDAFFDHAEGPGVKKSSSYLGFKKLFASTGPHFFSKRQSHGPGRPSLSSLCDSGFQTHTKYLATVRLAIAGHLARNAAHMLPAIAPSWHLCLGQVSLLMTGLQPEQLISPVTSFATLAVAFLHFQSQLDSFQRSYLMMTGVQAAEVE